MNCDLCGNLLTADGSCRYCERRRGWFGKSARRGCAVALVVAIAAGFLAVRHIRDLQQRSGIQWDEQMRGPWVRQKGKNAELYRIHIVNGQNQELDEGHRAYHAGDKLVANFHVRAAEPGRLQPRLLISGPSPIQIREPRPLEFAQGSYQQFHSSLILASLPVDAKPGPYVLHLEVEDSAHHKTFWETDIQVQKP